MADTLKNIIIALEDHFKANWDGTTPILTTVAFPNVAFTPPTGNNWLRFTPRFSGIEHLLMTGNQLTGQEITGILMFQVFVPANTGTATANGLVDKLVDLYHTGLRIASGGDEIIFDEPQPAGTVEGNDWYQSNVNAPFKLIKH